MVNELKPRNWEKPRTWVMPLTYSPKIAACKVGLVEQTIRPHWKMRPGDKVLFHDWKGRPYYSGWSWSARVDVVEAHPITVEPGCYCRLGFDPLDGRWVRIWIPWDSPSADVLATCDGIDPPRGKTLGELLCGMYDLRENNKFQVIRWKNWREIPPKRTGIARVVADEETATWKNQQASRNRKRERRVERTRVGHTGKRVIGRGRLGHNGR